MYLVASSVAVSVTSFLFFSNFLKFQLCILLIPSFSIVHFLGKSPVVQTSLVPSVVEVSSALTTAKGISSVITPVASSSATKTEHQLHNRMSLAVQTFPSATTQGWSGAGSFSLTVLPSVQVSVEPTTTITTSSLNGE